MYITDNKVKINNLGNVGIPFHVKIHRKWAQFNFLGMPLQRQKSVRDQYI